MKIADNFMAQVRKTLSFSPSPTTVQTEQEQEWRAEMDRLRYCANRKSPHLEDPLFFDSLINLVRTAPDGGARKEILEFTTFLSDQAVREGYPASHEVEAELSNAFVQAASTGSNHDHALLVEEALLDNADSVKVAVGERMRSRALTRNQSEPKHDVASAPGRTSPR